MMKQFQIAIDSMCVAAILSAGAPVLAEEVPDTSGVQLAMEYLLSQDASDNVKVSFQMDGTAESTEELTAIGEKLADRILQVLLKEGKESYQSSQYPYTESGFWLNYWYDESLGSCIGCVLDPTDNGLTVDIFYITMNPFQLTGQIFHLDFPLEMTVSRLKQQYKMHHIIATRRIWERIRISCILF